MDSFQWKTQHEQQKLMMKKINQLMFEFLNESRRIMKLHEEAEADPREEAARASLHHFWGLWRRDSRPLLDDPWTGVFHHKVGLRLFSSQVRQKDIFRLGKQVTEAKTSKQQSRQNPVSINRER